MKIDDVIIDKVFNNEVFVEEVGLVVEWFVIEEGSEYLLGCLESEFVWFIEEWVWEWLDYLVLEEWMWECFIG